MKYINFTTKQEEVFGLEASGYKISRVTTGHVPTILGQFIGGFWYSVTCYGPDDKDWWRSKCGHTVDLTLEVCPVCGEKRSLEP